MLVNFLEPGERLVVAVCGVFGERIANAAERLGIGVDRVAAAPGTPVDYADLARALAKNSAQAIAVVHGETSTGVVQPLGRPRRARTRTRRDSDGRLRDLAERPPAGDRRDGNRRRVQRNPEVSQLSARPRSIHRQRTGAASPHRTTQPGIELVLSTSARSSRTGANRHACTTTPHRSTRSTRCTRRWQSCWRKDSRSDGAAIGRPAAALCWPGPARFPSVRK